MGRHRNANIFVYLWMTAYSFHQHYIPDCVHVCNAFHVDDCHLYTADTNVTMYRNIARFFCGVSMLLAFLPHNMQDVFLFCKSELVFYVLGSCFFRLFAKCFGEKRLLLRAGSSSETLLHTLKATLLKQPVKLIIYIYMYIYIYIYIYIELAESLAKWLPAVKPLV